MKAKMSLELNDNNEVDVLDMTGADDDLIAMLMFVVLDKLKGMKGNKKLALQGVLAQFIKSV